MIQLHLPLLAAASIASTAYKPPPPTPFIGSVYNGRSRELAVQLPRVDADVAVQGMLDEPAWDSAALLTGFSQYAPNDGAAAVDSTQVLIWYSPTAIYFGIRAYEPRDQVRATLADRDKISQDDYIQILLSTFNDGRQATVFMVNPLGVQADGVLVEHGNLPGGGFTGGAVQGREAPDLSPDFVFQSKGHVTDWGYEVEVRIPFKSLKYGSADAQTWGINFVRKVQYRGHENSWAPAKRAAASFLSQSGTLVGLKDLHRGVVVDITPEVSQHTDGTPARSDAAAWSYAGQKPKAGANVRWGVTNNLTLNGTVNPDFSQIEADAGQISFDPRVALSFPEKRPFFLDGIEQFSTPNSLVYSRRIVEPVAAFKLTGKVGASTLALLSAVDATSASMSGSNNPVFNIIRLQRDVGAQSNVGMAYTDRIDGANWNRVLDVDGRWVMAKLYSLQLQLAGSATERAGVRTTAPLWEMRFNRNGRGLGWRSQVTGIADDFRTTSGFISRAGQVHANFNPRYSWFGKRGGLVEQAGGDILLDDIWAYRNFEHRGDARDKKLHFNSNFTFRGGWTAGASLLLESFGYDPAYYGNLYRIEVPRVGAPSDTLPFTGTPRLPNRDWTLAISSPQTKFITLSALGVLGQDENFFEWSSSHIRYLSLSADIRASEQLRIGGTFLLIDYLRASNDSRVGRQRDPRVKVEYQVTRNIFVRAIGEYSSNESATLYDDSRTGLPLLIRDPSTGTWVRATAQQNNGVRTDFLFAYKPIPGTVFYAGYGAQMAEPEAFAFRSVLRQRDAFFFKASYLMRL